LLPEEEKVIQLEFKWDRKSSASTFSLLQEDSDDEALKEILSPKAERGGDELSMSNNNISTINYDADDGEFESKGESVSYKQPSTNQPSTNFERENSSSSNIDNDRTQATQTARASEFPDNESYNETQRSVTIRFDLETEEEDNSASSPQKTNSTKSSLSPLRKSKSFLISESKKGSAKLGELDDLSEKDRDDSNISILTDEEIQIDQNMPAEKNFIQNNNYNNKKTENKTIYDPELEKKTLIIPHRRYELANYSREMVAINPSSYHQLGLALADSYLNKSNKNECI
jgi:hypothetical protein